MRDLRLERLEWCRQLRAACPPGEDRRLQRRNLSTALRPGKYRKRYRGPDGFFWKRCQPTAGEGGEVQQQCRVRSFPLARLKKAIAEELEYVDRDMTGLQAKTVVLLCWLAHDRMAHEVGPPICEFQQLPWDPWSEVDGEQYQGRALCDDQLGSLLPWVPGALAILRAIPRPSRKEEAVPLAPGAPSIMGKANPLRVLSEQEQKFRDIFLRRAPQDCLTGPAACEEYTQETGKGIDESDFRKRIVPALKAWGLRSAPKKGYYFPEDAPARRRG